MNDKSVDFDFKGKRIWVAGHTGMVGGAVMRQLQAEPCEVVTATRRELDLIDQKAVLAWLRKTKPDAIILAAAKVGGIYANTMHPAEFIYENLMISANIIHSAWAVGVTKLLNLGSACIYPRDAVQPMAEDALLSGPLEPTNTSYALAKISSIKLCEAYRAQYGCNFISAQPNNLYGIGDNFDLENSHVIPALILKAHEAKLRGDQEMVIWGSGTPLREFLYIEDLADALVFLLRHYNSSCHINVGTGEELSINEVAQKVCKTVDYQGGLAFDPSRPDGVPRKLLNSNRLLSMGWSASTSLQDGLKKTYAWFLERSREGDDLPRGVT